ncbi:hypothetical protein DFQ29_000694, partial [Apophysomyces sp. BC1021]
NFINRSVKELLEKKVLSESVVLRASSKSSETKLIGATDVLLLGCANTEDNK